MITVAIPFQQIKTLDPDFYQQLVQKDLALEGNFKQIKKSMKMRKSSREGNIHNSQQNTTIGTHSAVIENHEGRIASLEQAKIPGEVSGSSPGLFGGGLFDFLMPKSSSVASPPMPSSATAPSSIITSPHPPTLQEVIGDLENLGNNPKNVQIVNLSPELPPAPATKRKRYVRKQNKLR